MGEPVGEVDREGFRSIVEQIVKVVEGVGAGAIILGGVVATVLFVVRLVRRHEFHDAYKSYRDELGRAIVLGLEVLVAADIIQTIIVDPSLRSVLTLGLVVLVRTFLSFTLTAEIEGMWPWQRAKVEERRVAAQALLAKTENATAWPPPPDLSRTEGEVAWSEGPPRPPLTRPPHADDLT